MAGYGKDKKEIDPEELMRQKFLAKCRFRAIGRLVMANTYWMLEPEEPYEGDDVKKRVEQAVRLKTKKKQLLSLRDKALLNKPAHDRTDQEKKYLYRIIGGLKCFKRYPMNVKKKLASMTYFKYYGPDRVIVKQNQEAHALYFIVTGKVTVSHLVYDGLLKQYVSEDIGVMMAGDMFGEVSLLHNILRTATVTTNDHCEFLCLMKEDFKNVLQVSLQKQWEEVHKAMSAFTYFDSLDAVAQREGCIVARLKSYEINDVLLGDGHGIQNYVYFVLSGVCQMIESLEIEVTVHAGRTYFTLHDDYVTPEASEQDLYKKYFYAYNNVYKESTIYGIPTPEESFMESSMPSQARQSILKDVQKNTSYNRRKSSVVITDDVVKIFEPDQRKLSVIPKYESKMLSETISRSDSKQTEPNEPSMPKIDEEHVKQTTRFGSIAPSALASAPQPPPVWKPKPAPKKISKKRTIFMQVCQLNAGSSFGFGENMRDRRIVALTPVYCMLMPKVWLLQRNSANIWTRIQHYLDKKVPTKKQLFNEFVKQRRWDEFKTTLVEDIVSRSNTVNYTSVHDVPYSIRMEELFHL